MKKTRKQLDVERYEQSFQKKNGRLPTLIETGEHFNIAISSVWERKHNLNVAKKNEVHFSSQRLDWKTPKAVYQILDAEFSFDHDPCPANYKIDGLTSEWGQLNFVNPPYGNEIPKWIAKGFEEWKKGKTVVFLIPSRTDTRWWHDYCMKATEIRFIKGRLKFDDNKNPAPFPSAIVIFKANT